MMGFKEFLTELGRKDQINTIGKYHSDRMTKGKPNSKYHAVQRNRAMRLRNMDFMKKAGLTTAQGIPGSYHKEGRKAMLGWAAQDSKEAKTLKKNWQKED